MDTTTCSGRNRVIFAASMCRTGAIVLATMVLIWVGLARATYAAPVVFSGAGMTDATAALNAFRAAIGGANNGGAPPPQADGRREINWDAVKLDGTDFGGDTTVIILNKTVGIPVNRFQARGALFEEVYAVSGDGFESANAGVTGQFPFFSPSNTFAMFNDNFIDMSFVFPSAPNTTPVPAAVRGFGAIFIDVETTNTSAIEYFNFGTSIGKFFVPPGASAEPEFLGVLFDKPFVTSLRLTVGTAQIFSFNGTTVTPGPADITIDPVNGADLADTDDFVYSEPTVAAGFVGAPALDTRGVLFVAVVLLGFGVFAARRRTASPGFKNRM